MHKLYFNYYPDKQYILIETEGIIHYSDFQRMITEVNALSKKSLRLKIIIDLTHAIITLNLLQLDNLIKSITEISKKLESLRIAKIINGSKETAFAMIFQNQTSNLSKLEFEIFSTRSAAVNWLNV